MKENEIKIQNGEVRKLQHKCQKTLKMQKMQKMEFKK